MDLLVGYDGLDPRVVADIIELVVRDDRGESIEDMLVDLCDGHVR